MTNDNYVFPFINGSFPTRVFSFKDNYIVKMFNNQQTRRYTISYKKLGDIVYNNIAEKYILIMLRMS